MRDSTFIEHLWQTGQDHLAAMRYAAAVRCLEAAEAAAWRAADGVALARLYLPLLEARRQIRYQAADGLIVIGRLHSSQREVHAVAMNFLRDQHVRAGTLLLPAHHAKIDSALQLVRKVHDAARRQSRWLETLLLITHGHETRVASPADPAFAAGLPVKWTRDPGVMIGDASAAALEVPLPGAGRFDDADQFHPMARESLITAWEALALKWQHRHPPQCAMQPHIARGLPGETHHKRKFSANVRFSQASRTGSAPPLPQRHGAVWNEIAWLRRTLQIDPACEPVAMRLMSLAEAAARDAPP